MSNIEKSNIDPSSINPEERDRLPTGYHFAEVGTIELPELTALFESVGMGEDVNPERYETLAGQGMQIREVGVRCDVDGQLVGFGELIHDGCYEGVLSALAVHPSHQHKGIGKAIVDQRLTWAVELGLDQIYIDNIEPTNTLKAYYEEVGFMDYDGVFGRTLPQSNME